MLNGPIAVGGVGGSGTRAIAALLSKSGVYIGADLNESLDNLWFSLLFVRPTILRVSRQEMAELYEVFRSAMSGEPSIPVDLDCLWSRLSTADDRFGWRSTEWLRARFQSLFRAITDTRERPGVWGWKSPNTHMVIDHLTNVDPGLRYIHVVRHGLDMAFSSNQNQVRVWGSEVGLCPVEPTPAASLAFWCWAHRRIQKIGGLLGSRLLLVNFDELCSDPTTGVRRIIDFTGCAPGTGRLDALAEMIVRPASTGRWKKQDLSQFDDEDLQFVKSMGFTI